MKSPLHDFTATEALAEIRAGRLSGEALVRGCIERIRQCETELQCWSHFDESHALAQARSSDRQAAGKTLQGIPVAIKDMIYTADMPTRHNSPLYENHWPKLDAACVSLLRSAGAVIMGKATTVEFASMGRNAPTRNPRHPGHTPGGSSSGSAAAVAAAMVPLALGTQTGGSTIRPASFCGVYGMKPSYGLIPVEGVRAYAPSMDTVGLIARSVADIGLLCEALHVTDDMAVPDKQPAELKIGLFRTPMWSQADECSRRAVLDAAARFEAAGIHVEDIDHHHDFEAISAAQNTLMHGEGRRAFLAEYHRAPGQLHDATVGEAQNRLGITFEQLRRAYDCIARGRIGLEAACSGFDAWLTPAVVGEAPPGLESTGSALFNRGWSALHMPCITLPCAVGPSGLPVGIQLVAARFRDRALLHTAAICDRILRR